MLVKKDRGRGADLERERDVYGSNRVSSRIDGAELLQEAILRAALSTLRSLEPFNLIHFL
jgi:hypothetical protein